MQLVAGSHTADQWDLPSLRQFRDRQLCRYRIDGINDIIRSFFKQFFHIIRQYKGLIGLYNNLRIDIPDPLPHHFRLHPSDGTVICDRLPVDVRQRNLVIIDQDQPARTASCKCFDTVRAYAADTKYHDSRLLKSPQPFFSDQKFCSGIFIHLIYLLYF